MTYRAFIRGGGSAFRSPYRISSASDDPLSSGGRGLGFVGVDVGAPYDDVYTGAKVLPCDKPYCDFQQSNWSSDEVYVFRFQVILTVLDSFLDAYPYVDAYIRAMPIGNRNQNIIGVALKPIAPPLYQGEIVFTDAGGLHLNADTAATTIAKMNDVLVKSGSLAKGNLVAINGHYAYLNQVDTAAMQDWLSKPAIWSYQRFDATGDGRTTAWQNGDGVYLGSAVSPQKQLKPRSQPEIGPPPATVTDETKKLAALLGNPAMSPEIVIGGVAVAGGLLYWMFGRKKQ